MDPATITTVIKTTHTVVKIGTQIYDYIRDDQTAKLGLLQPVRIVVEGPGVGIGDFQSPDRLFTMFADTINKVTFLHAPFPPDSHSPWNGPDGIPNDWAGGSLPASLTHDFICLYLKQIASELELTEDEVWEWAASILSGIWEHYGNSTTQAKTESWFAYNIVRNIRRPYYWLKRKLGFASIILLAITLTGCSGCLKSRPPYRVTHADPIISVERGVVTTNAPLLQPIGISLAK